MGEIKRLKMYTNNICNQFQKIESENWTLFKNMLVDQNELANQKTYIIIN